MSFVPAVVITGTKTLGNLSFWLQCIHWPTQSMGVYTLPAPLWMSLYCSRFPLKTPRDCKLWHMVLIIKLLNSSELIRNGFEPRLTNRCSSGDFFIFFLSAAPRLDSSMKFEPVVHWLVCVWTCSVVDVFRETGSLAFRLFFRGRQKQTNFLLI